MQVFDSMGAITTLTSTVLSIDQNMEPARVPNPAFEAQREGDANLVRF